MKAIKRVMMAGATHARIHTHTHTPTQAHAQDTSSPAVGMAAGAPNEKPWGAGFAASAVDLKLN